jgi:DNA-binding MarR family transcriptional regulator
VTRNVGTLKKKKLINVKGSKDDKRMKCITITKEGEEKLCLIDADVRECIGRAFQGVSKSDFETYKNVLEKITRNKIIL